MFAHISRRSIAAALLAATLAGCASQPNQPSAGQPTSAATATAQPTSRPAQPTATQPTAAPQPTSRPAQPTATQPTAAPQPTSRPAQPTAAQPTAAPQPTNQPAQQPAFGFDPRSGAAGAQINLNGWDFTPGSDIAVRLGTPQAIGEALASARVDAAGRWAGSFTLPSNLPSGDPVPAGQIALVVMDANTNQPLASAPFDFQPADGPTRPQAMQTVADLLHAVGTQAAWGYLASNLDRSLPVEQSLGLKHHWVTYEVGAPLDRPSEVLFVPATLVGDTELHYYNFTLVVEQGAWKINGASWLSSEPLSQAPGTYDYSNIGTVVLRQLHRTQPGTPVLVGAVATSGTYAAAYALPHRAGKQFLYLRQAPGAGWEIVLISDAPTPEQLASAGIPATLLRPGDVSIIVDALIARYNAPSSGGADGWLSVEAIADSYARATLHRSADGDLTIFLHHSNDGWAVLIDGPSFTPEALDQFAIPASVRP